MLKWIIDYLYRLIFGTPEDQAIKQTETDIATKKIEADVKLKELSDLGVLKTTAGNAAVQAEADVSKADVARKNAQDATDASTAVAPVPHKNETADDLEKLLNEVDP